MRTVTLNAVTDQETGELGLMVKGTPVINYPMAATEGLLIAHDLLEHVRGVKAIGSVGDELLALGGVWFVRGEYGTIRQNSMSRYTPHQNIAADIVNLGRIYFSGIPYRVPVPRTLSHSLDSDFEEILREAKKDLIVEVEDLEITNEQIKQYLHDCLHFLRRGYNLANKKYKKNQFAASQLFWNIAESVDEVIKYIEFEGQQFKLKYSLKDYDLVQCTEYYPQDEYY